MTSKSRSLATSVQPIRQTVQNFRNPSDRRIRTVRGRQTVCRSIRVRRLRTVVWRRSAGRVGYPADGQHRQEKKYYVKFESHVVGFQSASLN